MKVSRLLCFLFLVCLFGIPIFLLVQEFVRQFDWIGSWDTQGRFVSLVANTILLILGTLVFSLPIGVFLAFLFFRTDLPFRNSFRLLVVVSLFLPLPLQIVTWQSVLENGWWILSHLWTHRPGQPWAQGFIPSLWVYTITSIPWIIVIVGQSFLRMQSELEEEALLYLSRLNVFWRVTLRNSRPAIILSALWVTILVSGDVSVTDMFQVRTFGEEVYLVFSQGGEVSLGQAVMLSLPFSLALAGIVFVLFRCFGSRFPGFQAGNTTCYRYLLGSWRWLWIVVSLGFFGLLIVIPAGSLVWKGGLSGVPATWSIPNVFEGLESSFVLDGMTVFQSVLLAVLCGLFVAVLSLWICITIRNQPRLQGFYFLFFVLAVAFPACVIGFGIKEAILLVVRVFPQSGLAKLLYFGPSHVPLIWAYLLRTLPVGMAILWPVFRKMPTEIHDMAKLDRSSPWKCFLYITVPWLLPTLGILVVCVSALALSELGTSKLVNTPGIQTFTILLFDRMHYGVSRDVACLGLILVLLVFVFALEVSFRKNIVRFCFPVD